MCEYIFHYIGVYIYEKHYCKPHECPGYQNKWKAKYLSHVFGFILISAQLFLLPTPECVVQMV